MKILTPGHRYELGNFEKKDAPGQILQFIEKVRLHELSPELRTVNDGTTNEEVLAVLIDRMQSLNATLASRETALAITKCQEALMWLEKRTADRLKRSVEGTART